MLALKTVLTFSVSLFRTGLAFIGLYFVARFMGPEPIGELGFGLGIIGMYSFILYMGFDNAHVKRVSEGKDASVCIGTYAAIRVFLTLLFITIFVSSVIFWERLFDSAISGDRKLILVILMLVASIESLTRIATNTFNARVEVVKVELPNTLRALIQPPIKIFVALTSIGAIYGAVALASANLVGSIIALIASIILLSKLKISKPDYRMFKSYLDFAFPAMLITILFRITTHIDKVIIGTFFGIKEVGYYYTTSQIFTVFLMASGSVATLLFPVMSLAHSKGDFSRINFVAQKSERYLSLFLTPISSIIFIYAEPIIYFLLGKNFLPAVPLFQIAAINTLLISLNRAYNNIILACNQPRLMAKINFAGRIITLCFFVFLIPKEIFGIKLMGLGAFGALLSRLIWNILYTFIIRFYGSKLANVKYVNYRILKHFVAAFIISALSFYLLEMFIVYNFFHFFCLLLFFILSYSFILAIMKELTKDDLILFKKITSPQKMKEYFLDEFHSK